MALINDDISYTGLVEKYIGSAYDKVALVADNLDAILAIGGGGTGDHSVLLNRDLADAHAQAAITNLVTDLAALVAADLALQTAYDNLVVTHSNHTDNTDIHFADVPVNGVEYVRLDKAWVVAAAHNHDLAYDPLGAGQAAADVVQGNLDTHEAVFVAHHHNLLYDALGAAAAVQASVDNLAVTVNSNLTSLNAHIAEAAKHTPIYSGIALPAPGGYNEGDVFLVTP